MKLCNIGIHSYGEWVIESDTKYKASNMLGVNWFIRTVVQSRQCKKCSIKQYKSTDINV